MLWTVAPGGPGGGQSSVGCGTQPLNLQCPGVVRESFVGEKIPLEATMLRRVLAIYRTASPPARAATFALVALTAALSFPAAAQDEKDQRYVFHEVDDGILRLDTRLGEMSLCSRQSVGWACRTVPDERNALDAELARLQQENAELKSALAAQTRAKPDTSESEKSADALSKKPSTGDLARVRAVVGMIWHRLVEMMAALRADLDKEG